ncbi:MAG: helical backbone metal receptor [Myxococcota bacterium]
MKKPEHQWETRLHRAVRRPTVPDAFADDARAESFELRFADGRTGTVTAGLQRQHADAVAASDPDLAHAVSCWLVARGVRQLALRGPEGVLAEGPLEVAALGSTPTRAARVITLAPSNAEVVHALGAFDRVVACEDSSDFPAAVSSLERLGPDLGPDLDRVAALAPDLVISSLSVPGMERIVTGLRARGVPQIVLAPRSFADVLADIARVAAALDVSADAVLEDLRAQKAKLEAACPQVPTRVYLEWWPKPMFTPGAQCYSNELIALAGGRNVFGDRPGSSLQVDADEVVRADPQVCFVSWCGVAEEKLDPQNLIGREGLGTLEAARAGQVYPLDERFSGRPGPRMLEAARRMAAAIRRATSRNA